MGEGEWDAQRSMILECTLQWDVPHAWVTSCVRNKLLAIRITEFTGTYGPGYPP